jgi:SAM-dependent methyltransferase
LVLERLKGFSRFHRVEQPELLDLGCGTDQDVAENLAEMQRFNDLLGGTRALAQQLFPRLAGYNHRVAILDLGAGGAGISKAIVRQARRLGIALEVLAVDWSARSLAVAARGLASYPEIRLLRADALRLPFAPGQFDYVISSLFLHHFTPPQLCLLLRHAYALAGRALVMSDLVRGRAPLLAFRLAQPLLARNFLTRYDGALSIRRAYTPDELMALAQTAGLPNPRLERHWPWRMTLVVDRG